MRMFRASEGSVNDKKVWSVIIISWANLELASVVQGNNAFIGSKKYSSAQQTNNKYLKR